MLALCCGLMVACLSGEIVSFANQDAAAKSPAAGQRLTYSGSVEPLAGGGTESSRTFRLVSVVTEVTAGGGAKLAWVVEETGGKPRWPWSQRFGGVSLTKSLQIPNDREIPAIQGQLDGMVRAIPLALPFFADASKVEAGAEWDDGPKHFEVVAREEVGGRRCWVVSASTKQGGRAIDWVDENQPVVVRHRELVFLGQGVQHELRLDLDRVEPLAADDLARHAKAHAAFTALRGPVKDKLVESQNPTPPATAEFLNQARSALGGLAEDRQAGPYAELAADMLRETQRSLDQQKAVERLRAQLVGKPVPDFSLTTTRGDKISPADFKNKPLVLHFWEYRSEPKIAPYGETGYLDFLWRQREKQGIRVVGIAVDDRLRPDEAGAADRVQRAAAHKDIRGFCEFMNLSFPVAFDESKVIDLFGDPRRTGMKLPLYIVVAPDGTVAEYHVGLWSATADEGLKELDQRLQKLSK